MKLCRKIGSVIHSLLVHHSGIYTIPKIAFKMQKYIFFNFNFKIH
jgi:hypothetical protein